MNAPLEIRKDFNKDNPDDIKRLSDEISQSIQSENIDSIRSHFMFCIEQWSNVKDCPIDRGLLDQGIAVIEGDLRKQGFNI